MTTTEERAESLAIAERWCQAKGAGWALRDALGRGGTAPVFEVMSPDGPRALKIYDSKFCVGELGKIELKRLEQQLTLKGHGCPQLVQIFDGGVTDGRLFLLMERAAGTELEKQLKVVPRERIREIVDQVARAAIFLGQHSLCHRDIKAANVFISDDYQHCTLLDVSVVRDIHDPVGVGTDHDGQLPVVATARYSPPEYLFRLIDAGPEQWHSLTVYQLGALLHDLIMREPLFQGEYERSRENRYRFAWLVATSIPDVRSDEVDQDLVLLATRALDKDWKRRSSLRLEDFLADESARKTNALHLLGLGRPPASPSESNLAAKIARLGEVARGLDSSLVDYLKGKGVTVKHEIEAGQDDTSVIVLVSWQTDDPVAPGSLRIELRVDLTMQSLGLARHFAIATTLTANKDSNPTIEALELPDVEDDEAATRKISTLCIAAFEKLAVDVATAGVP